MNKIWFLPLIFLIMLAGCTLRNFSLLPRASLLILQQHFEKSVDETGELTAQITGVARNTSTAELQYAEVIGKFYDKDGTLLYSGVTSTTNLDPGQIWEFTIPYSSAPRDVHSSLNILSWELEKDSSGARIIGEAENNGDVMLSFAEITGTFYNRNGVELASATATTTSLRVGEIWEYTIVCPYPNFQDVVYTIVEVTDTDYEPVPTQDVHHATVEVGALRGRTVMP